LFSPPGHPNVFSEISKDSHAKKRKVLSYAFSGEALKSMQEYMLQHIRDFCSVLESSESISMSKLTEYLSMDIMGELAFGQSLGMLLSSKSRHVVDFMTTSAHYCQMVLYNFSARFSPHLD
jgi:cytochrome P450